MNKPGSSIQPVAVSYDAFAQNYYSIGSTFDVIHYGIRAVLNTNSIYHRRFDNCNSQQVW